MANIPRKPTKPLQKREPEGNIDPSGSRSTSVRLQAENDQYRAQIDIHSGPFPSPDALAKYKMLYPEAAKIIFDTFQKQAEHRIWLEKTSMIGNQRRSWGGLVAGTAITLSIAGVAVYSISKGFPWPAATIVGTSLAALAGVFVLGTNSAKAERVSRLDKMMKVFKPKKDEPAEKEDSESDDETAETE